MIHAIDCERVHLDCANEEIRRLRDLVATLREELAATRRALLFVPDKEES